MAHLSRNATEMLAMLCAVAVVQSAATAAEPPPGAKSARAEVQIGLCATPEHIVHALGLRPSGGPMEVWQFDDSALGLLARGLRLRLRVMTDGRSEFTLKVADQDCARLDPTLVPTGSGKCEYDIYGTRTAGAVSLTRNFDARSTNDLLAGRMAPAQALSASQIRYLREIAGVWPLPPGIRALGPMQVRSFRTKDKLYAIDISQLPAGEQYAEISRKVPLADATSTMEIMATHLAQAGVQSCADQSSQVVNKLRSLLR